VARVNRHKPLFVFAAMMLLAGVVGGAWWLASRHPSSNQLPSREVQVTQITANPEDRAVSSAQISPDGRYLAYADPTGIQVRFIDTGTTQRIPETRGMNVYAWSADGSRIRAVACDTATCVDWDLPLVGGGRRPSGAVWSAGDWIVASADGARRVKISATSSEARMELLDASGPQLLVREAANGVVEPFVDASWSIDGHQVLFTRGNTPSLIEAVDVTGGSSKVLFTATNGLKIQHPGLQLLDGRLITALWKDDAVALWEIPAPIGAGRAVGVPRRLTEWKPRGTAGDLSASADGHRIAFLEGGWHSDVYIAAFDHRAGRLLDTPRRLTTDERGNVARDWTPDGRAVLFESYRNGNADIFQQDITTESPEPLIVRPGDQTRARVTNDGRWILFREVDPGSGGARAPVRIMRVPISGGVPQQVFAGAAGTHFNCSPQGRCVLLEQQGNQMVVSSLDAVRGKGGHLATIPFWDWGDALLPDGDHFALIVDGVPRNRLRIVSFRGEPARDIIVGKAIALSGLHAAPDGSGFFSRNGTGPRTDLLFIRPDGTSHVLLGQQGSFRPRGAVASPDATHLAIEAMTAKIDVWMLQGN
jgi:hypothetical protein